MERFILPPSSSKIRNSTIFFARAVASSGESPFSTPRSTSIPGPMRECSWLAIVTLARETRWMTAFTKSVYVIQREERLAAENVVPNSFGQRGDLGNQRLLHAKFFQRLAEVLHNGVEVTVVES